MNLQKLLTQAERSAFYKWLLNRGLNYTIPFNSPHRFEVLGISDHELNHTLLVTFKIFRNSNSLGFITHAGKFNYIPL